MWSGKLTSSFQHSSDSNELSRPIDFILCFFPMEENTFVVFRNVFFAQNFWSEMRRPRNNHRAETIPSVSNVSLTTEKLFHCLNNRLQKQNIFIFRYKITLIVGELLRKNSSLNRRFCELLYASRRKRCLCSLWLWKQKWLHVNGCVIFLSLGM